MNIASRLLENFEWSETGKDFEGEPIRQHKNIEFAFTETLHVFADNVEPLETDLVVFISSHKSEAGKPTLSTHPIGNWGKAELGGKDKTIIPTNPGVMKKFLLGLQAKQQERELDYEISLECTHHGPLLSKPTIFIEIGSSPKEWADEKAALAVAEVVMENIRNQEKFTNCVGLGGQHYPHEFTKIELRTDYALGHMCPKHNLAKLDTELLQQAIKCSVAEKIVLDWKGLGPQKQQVKELVEATGIEVLRSKSILK